jgi:membrane-associated protein
LETLQLLFFYLRPEGIARLIQTFGIPGICLIIFAETGFFALLPGDSLLVLCGIFAATLGPDGQPLLPLWALLTFVPLCGILGDQVGFWLGKWAGKAVYGWNDFLVMGFPIYRRDYLKRTENFYNRWGRFTIVAGRWVPIVRTFAPIVAGVTRMPFRTFLAFNVVGGLTWVASMVFAGYWMDAFLKRVFPNFELAKNIDKIAFLVVLLSLMPIIYTLIKERGEKQRSPLEKRAGERRRPGERRKKSKK